MQRVIERILNLLAFLLTVDRPVTSDEIRRTVAGYDQSSTDAWHRMFERDKELLRSLGIPLDLTATDVWEVEQGYVVNADDYSLPNLDFDDDERAALSLAAEAVRLGAHPSAPDALLKLGGAPFSGGGEPLAADLGTDTQALAEAFLAITEHRVLQFSYSGRSRAIEPYGLVYRRGHWYVIGVDRNGGEIVKVFRVDRATGMLAIGSPNSFVRPQSFSVSDAIPTAAWEAGSEDIEAEVEFDSAVAWWARRQLRGGSRISERADGSIVAKISVANPEAFIGWVLSFDAAAEILAPEDLRWRLVQRVKAAG